MKIIPAIFEKQYKETERKLNLIKNVSSWVQIDVSDGLLVDGKSFELELLNSFNYEDKLWDIHLMVKDPVRWLKKCMFVGATRVIGQVEMMKDRNEFVTKAKDLGLEAGLAFDISTDIDDIPKETDTVLLMGRKMGFGSYPLDESVFKKINKIKDKFRVGVDGGVSIENIDKLKSSGVDTVYVTAALFNGDIEENINLLKQYANF